MRAVKLWPGFSLSVWLLSAASPAAAQAQPAVESSSIENRLASLEQQLETLRQVVARLSSGPPSVNTAADSDPRFDAFDQQIRTLARKLELEREQTAEAAKQAPAVRAGRDGFTLRAADGSFQLRLRGYVQSDSRVYLHDQTKAADSFVLRRVRPILEGSVFKQFDFRLMPDFGEGRTVVQDAYLDARFHPYFQVRAGKFKSPMGLERLASATDLLFIERALPTALVPNRDIGVTVHGDSRGALTYAAGVFNGVPDGASTDADDQDGKDIVARIFVLPFKSGKRAALQGLGVGIATSYGVQRGAAAAPNVPSYKTAGQQTFFRFRSDGTDAGTTVAAGEHLRVSAQGHYYRGRTGLLAEHVVSSQRLRRGAAAVTARNTAWQVAGSCVLTGEKASYRGITPVRAFDRSAGAWGALELTARYNGLTVDSDVFPFFANPGNAARAARGAGVGVNWYLNTSVKISADYERTQFSGGVPSARRAAEHDVLTRFQISF